ncbi:MAG: DNA repair protein RadC [Bacteroidota bacterium]|nr:DNA repair protein RadC [Bacteroidota bacterium]
MRAGEQKEGWPRERLFHHGPDVLSNAELIALVLGTGARRRTPVDVAQRLLAMDDSLRDLAARGVRDFTRIDRIGPGKATRLAAAFELGRRLPRTPRAAAASFRSPADVFREYGPVMADLKHEVFRVVLLNTAHVRISDFVASEGGIASSIVEPRLIFRRAILEHAAAVICIHNHPSGNPEPSREDEAVTRQLVQAGQVLSVPLRDHVIIAGDTYTSLAERGLLIVD